MVSRQYEPVDAPKYHCYNTVIARQFGSLPSSLTIVRIFCDKCRSRKPVFRFLFLIRTEVIDVRF